MTLVTPRLSAILTRRLRLTCRPRCPWACCRLPPACVRPPSKARKSREGTGGEEAAAAGAGHRTGSHL